MQLETVVTAPSSTRTTPKLAYAEGLPLVIDPGAPTTLTGGLVATAKRLPSSGVRFIGGEGKEQFVAYPELLRRAQRIQAGLQAAGFQPGSRALLQLDSLEEHFAAFWGCLLAGIVPTTVAIAPTYQQRNGVVDKLANAWQLLERPVVITTDRLLKSIAGLETVAGMTGLSALSIQTLQACDAPPAPHSVHPDDVAFIQLSSGSTGIPKCIQQTHSNIIAHIHSSAAFNGYSSDDVTFNWLPVDHVVPILTFHLKDTYLGCQQLHAPASYVLGEPLNWLDVLERFRVSHTWAPNFGFKLVSDRLARVSGRAWDLSCVRFFMNAGEQVTMPVVREFLNALKPFGVRESAMQPAFGMAEVCTCMTYANDFSVANGARRFSKSSLGGELIPCAGESVDSVEFVSLGKVTPGIAIRIANGENQTVRECQIGRFQIKGPVVTPGYYRNPEANQDAFVGDGWFNTGDLGFIADGELFLTGREKEMIIIRGAKYYCYEVEDVVNSIPGVEPTFVATCGTSDPETGTETLAVFFVPAGVTDPLAVVQAVRRRVTAGLGITPGFIVPMPREKFPKTTSGKIQRTQLKKLLESGAFADLLKELAEADGSDAHEHSSSEVEAQVAQIWREVLGETRISPQAHIFEVGGDSLKATRIASRIRDEWQLEFPLHLLFGSEGTIRGMAEWISAHLADELRSDTPPPIYPTPRSAVLPLSYSQLRLWLADQIDPGTSLYNIGRAYSLHGALDFAALESALKQLVQRHEILRTVYSYESMPQQQVLPTMDIPLPRHDLSHLAADEQSRVVANLLSLEISRPFDLENGPLMRAKVVRLGEAQHMLLIVWHQIVTDAWSLNVFCRELASAYNAVLSGNTGSLPTLEVQYADYATWQQRWLADPALEKQLQFWREELAATPPALHLNGTEGGGAEAGSEVREIVLEPDLLERLRKFNASANVTHFMTLQTVYKVLLAQLSGSSDIAVGSPESGRRRGETEALLGCFVNMLTLRTRIHPTDTWRELLGRVRDTTIRAFSNADVPFEKVQAVTQHAGEERSRLFHAWFGPIDSLEPFNMGELQVLPRPVFPPEAQFDISCFLSEQPGRISLFLEYKLSVFSRDEAAKVAVRFTELLREFIANPDGPVRIQS